MVVPADKGHLVRFSEADLELFSKASGDRNPLHLSETFASKTAYGQRVVFGVLGCLASLGALGELDRAVKRVVADFQRPMFLDVEYRVESNESQSGWVSRVFDGSIPVLTVNISTSTDPFAKSQASEKASFPTETAREVRWEELREGSGQEAFYRADGMALAQLCERFGIQIDYSIVEALLWSSYFVGMELPGRDALFFRAVIDFFGVSDPSLPIRFRTQLINVNSSLSQIRTKFELHSDSALIASGSLTSFVRPNLPSITLLGNNFAEVLPANGRAGLVIGASRGLGAAIATALASEGFQVFALSRSALTWLPDVPSEISNRIEWWEGDAADPQSLAALALKIKTKAGRLDLLVCSAFPAIPSLRLEPAAAGRIQDYICRAMDLVVKPLCEFLPMLNESGGRSVLISTIAVENAVRDWPHYGAAKSATEALFRTAPMQYPQTSSLVIRPKRLLTEMTNTPTGRRGALSPMILAQQVRTVLRRPATPGTCELYCPPDLDEQAAELELHTLSSK